MAEEVPADWPSIRDFFTGRSIFITGATGFIGKGIIEKLLRSCPDIGKIYLLIRPRKDTTSEERLKKMSQHEIFDEVRKRNPAYVEKLIPIKGDIAEENLGISNADRKILSERVSIVFHIAANVKFNVSLSLAVLMNTRATRDMYVLAKSMKNLVAFVHVSSAYTQTHKMVIDEIYYDPEVDWKKLITLAETVDKRILDVIMLKFIIPMPNSYTFTKRVAEKVVYDFSKNVPCVLSRPSIVVPAVKEPIAGWMENLSGPTGMVVGILKGLLRVGYMQPNVGPDYIPVDATVKALLIAAWKRGIQTMAQDSSLHIYNFTSTNLRVMKHMELSEIGHNLKHLYPLSNPIWYPSSTLTTCYYYYFILLLLFQILPSVMLDTVLSLWGKPRQLLKLQRTIYTVGKAYDYFMCNKWEFNNKKYLELLWTLRDVDKEDFSFNYGEFGTTKYCISNVLGARRFILHEDVANIPKDKKYIARLYWLRLVKNILLVGFFAWYLMRFEIFPYKIAIIGGLCLIPFLKN